MDRLLRRRDSRRHIQGETEVVSGGYLRNVGQPGDLKGPVAGPAAVAECTGVAAIVTAQRKLRRSICGPSTMTAELTEAETTRPYPCPVDAEHSQVKNILK
jgi:hypothetical protein